jgi:orotidine 5'-phosphate decarboxylase subfamily 2
MRFADKLERGWTVSGGCLCVGLDPDIARTPPDIARSARPVLAFNKLVVDAVGDLACAFKPQFAHFAAHAAEADLAETIAYIRATQPHAFIVLDAKRGDIGSTAEMYAREAFERYDADAVTVNPYMGDDTVTPFPIQSASRASPAKTTRCSRPSPIVRRRCGTPRAMSCSSSAPRRRRSCRKSEPSRRIWHF